MIFRFAKGIVYGGRSSRTKLAAKTYFTGLTGSLAVTFLGFVATPILLHLLGDSAFGSYKAATDWAGYLVLLDSALAGATVPLLSRSLGNGDVEQTEGILIAAIRTHAISAIISLVAGLILASQITILIPVAPHLRHDLRVGFILGLVTVLLQPLTPARVFLEVKQQGAVINILLLLQGVISTGLGLLFAWYSWGITGQFSASIIAGLSMPFVLMWILLREHPRLFRLASRPRDHVFRDVRLSLWRGTRSTFFMNLSGRASLMSDGLLTAYYLGPMAVVILSLTQRLPILALSQVAQLGSSSWAGLVELGMQGDVVRLREGLKQTTTLTSILGVSCAVPIYAYNESFIKLWIGASRYGGDIVTGLALLNGILLAIFSLWSLVLRGMGHLSDLGRISIIASIVNVTASLILTKKLGLSGPLWGTFISFITVYIWALPKLLSTHEILTVRGFFESVVKPIGLGILLAIGLRYLTQHSPRLGWLMLSIQMSMAMLVYTLIAWFLVFSGKQKTIWKDRLMTLIYQKHS